MKLLAIVPAYNEEAGIHDTLTSLLSQTRKPDTVVVVANNCSDRTVEIARTFPVRVINMTRNPDKKSGAMNMAWSWYSHDHDLVFTMDGDTTLEPDTLEMLEKDLLSSDDIGAVTARYWAKESKGLARRLQRLEYARFDDNRELREWKVQVASGAAVMYRQTALLSVCDLHERAMPWDTSSLIEDYAMTLDIKTVGMRAMASADAHVYTDTPATFRELWAQRLRWGRGGVDEVRKRGWTRATRRDIGSYGLFGLSTFMRILFLVYIAFMIAASTPYQFALIGLVPMILMYLDRVTSVSRLADKTWPDRLLVHTVLVEDLYGFFLETCTIMSIIKSYRSSQQSW